MAGQCSDPNDEHMFCCQLILAGVYCHTGRIATFLDLLQKIVKEREFLRSDDRYEIKDLLLSVA
jgi:hypothetical protein